MTLTELQKIEEFEFHVSDFLSFMLGSRVDELLGIHVIQSFSYSLV